MNRRLNQVLIALSTMLCMSLQAQVLTDWQREGLKGQVKQLTKLYSHDSGKQYKEVIDFDANGFIISKVSYSNIDPMGYYGDLKLNSKYSYSDFKNNKRSITILSFEYGKTTPQSKLNQLELWDATKKQVICIFGGNTIAKNEYVVRAYNKSNQLTTEEYFNKNKKSDGSNKFFYNTNGVITKKNYNYNNQYYVLDGDEINSIGIKTDTKGNITKQEFKRKSIDGFYTEESIYVYFE